MLCSFEPNARICTDSEHSLVVEARVEGRRKVGPLFGEEAPECHFPMLVCVLCGIEVRWMFSHLSYTEHIYNWGTRVQCE